MFINLNLKNINSTWTHNRNLQTCPEHVDPNWYQDFINVEPSQPLDGMFLCDTLNFETMYLDNTWDCYFLSTELQQAINDKDYTRMDALFVIPQTYGVCDSIEQFKETETYKFFNEAQDEYIVVFSPITKKDVGWRWEKWGPYIGNQISTADYIQDEKFIEKVFVFSIYKKVK